MESDDGRLNYSIRLETDQLKRDIWNAKQEFKGLSDQVSTEASQIDGIFSKIKKTVGSLTAAWSFQQFATQIARVRGEFQQLEVAMETMLGSKEKANALMDQMVRTAATTPFSLQDVAGGAKQLLAYGMASEEVNDSLVRLGNIASGLSIPLNDIIYLYGTTMTQGRLYAQDLNQFTGRGIPMVKELAAQFGVAEDKVKEMVSAGKVGFPEVEKVIKKLTNEGGMFYNLMEKQSHTITGQISNIEDAFDSMLNDIGQSNEGIINDALGATSALVENYEKVGEIIGEVIAVYGVYKATLITLTAIENLRYQATLAHMAGFTKMQAVTEVLTAKMKALHAVIASNPYTVAAVAVAALAAVIYKLATYQTEYEEKLEKLDDSVARFTKDSISEQRSLAQLKGELSGLKKGTDEYNQVKDKIIKGYGKYYDGLEDEIEKVGLTEQAYNKLTEAITRSYGARQYEQFSKEQGDEFDSILGENLKKIQDKLHETLGDEQGSRFYAKIRDALLQNKITTGKNQYGQGILQGLDAETMAAIKKSKGDGFLRDGTVELAIRKAIQARKELNELDKLARERFGIVDKPAEKAGGAATESKESSTYLKDVEKAKAEWKAAKKGYEDILKDQKATSKQVLDARAEMAEKEKAYFELSGTKKSPAKKEMQEEADYSRELLQLRKDNEEREITFMKDGSEKKIAEISLRYSRQIQEVKAFEEKLKEAQNGTLTDEQQSMIDRSYSGIQQSQKAERDKVLAEDKKAANEKVKNQEKAWNDYLRLYGNYEQKRSAIEKSYDDRIKEASTAGEAAILYKEKMNALDEFDNKMKSSTTLMGELFADSSEKSVSELQNVIDRAEQLMDYLGGKSELSRDEVLDLGISENSLQNLEGSTEEVESLKNAIKGLKGELGSRSPWKAFTTNLKEGINAIRDAKGSTEEVGKGISKVGNSITTFAPAMKEFGNSLGAIFGNDKLASTIGGISDAIGGLGQTASGVGQIMSGDIVGGAMSAVSGIGSVVSAFEGLFGADYSEYENMKERYETLTSLWDDLISKKTEYIDIDYGIEAQKAADEAEKLINTNIQRQRNLLEKLAKSGSSIGSHSLGYRINDRLNSGDWARLSNLLGKTIKDQSDLWKLSKEEIEKILTDEKLISVLDTVNSDFITYLQNIVKYGEQLDDVAEKEKGAIAGLSFEDFRNGYIDMIADLETTNEDFAESFEKQLQNAIFRAMIADQYSERIQALYDAWVTMGKDGLTQSEAEDLRNQQKQLTDELLAKREEMMKMFGWEHKEEEKQSTEIKGVYELQKAYAKLNEVISKVYSSDRVRVLQDQNKNLTEQKKLVEERIAIEKDEDSLRNYKEQLENINKQIEDNKDAMKDAIFGSDIQAAIGSFVSAYTSALGNGDTSGVARDFIKNMIKGMVIEAMKADASPVVTSIRAKLIEAWKDGVISSEEQAEVEALVGQLNKEFSDKFGWADGMFKEEEKKSSEIAGLQGLQQAYSDLSDAVSRAYSTDKVKLIEQQVMLLEQQKELLESNISGTDDQSLINTWNNKLNEVKEQISASRDAQIDAIFGSDIQSAISSFADAFVNAWAKGEDKAKSTQQVVNNIIRGMITESIKADIAPQTEELRKKLKEMYADGTITDAEKEIINGLVNNMTSALEGQYGWADQFIREEQEVVEDFTEVAEEVKETFSGITFESARDEFVSQLASMETSYEDMCNNMEDKLKQSILKGFLESRYKNQIQSLLSTWDMYGESGNIDEGEIQQLREQYKSLLDAMLNDRDDLADKFGWQKFQQEGTRGMSSSMSEETGSELNGRMTAVQTDVSAMRMNSEEIRNLQLSAVDHLEDISRNTHELFQINRRLANIENNTSRL